MSLLGKVHTTVYEAFLQTTKKSKQDSRSNYKLEKTGGQWNILNWHHRNAIINSKTQKVEKSIGKTTQFFDK